MQVKKGPPKSKSLGRTHGKQAVIYDDSGDDADSETNKRHRRVYKEFEGKDYKTSEEDEEDTDVDVTKRSEERRVGKECLE